VNPGRQGVSTASFVHHSGACGSFPWQKNWRLECPNKVKIFAWRLAHNNLPLKRKIESRGIELDTRCPICWRLDEDACHLLFRCKFSKGVWRESQLENIRLQLAALSSPKEVFHYLWDCVVVLQVKLITLMWVLTFERNAVNAGERMKNVSQAVGLIQKYYLEFREFFTKTKDENPIVQKSWTKPRTGFLKGNVDASFKEETMSGDWGCVIRNEEGGIEGAGMGKISVVSSILQAEATACLEAMRFTTKQGMMAIELETGCLNLKIAIQSREWDQAPEGMLIREIRFFISSSFNNVSLLHVSRSCNVVAHSVAHEGATLNSGSRLVWLENFPAFVNELSYTERWLME
jgi:hypothetical protein